MSMLAQSAVQTTVFKGTDHSKNYNLSFTYTHDVPQPCDFLLSNTKREFLWNILCYSFPDNEMKVDGDQNCRASKKSRLVNLIALCEEQTKIFIIHHLLSLSCVPQKKATHTGFR